MAHRFTARDSPLILATSQLRTGVASLTPSTSLMRSAYLTGITALVAPRISDASGDWKSTSAPTFCRRSAMSPRVPLAMPTSSMTIATSTATASTETAVRVLRCITLAAARFAIRGSEDDVIIGSLRQETPSRTRMMRFVTRARRLARVVARGAWALADRRHPILAQVVPMRRCNLACAYCNEYDAVSSPVPLPDMLLRLDKLAELGTSMITVSGGEPLLHPDLDVMVAHMRRRGMVSSVITNGYYLSPDRIRRFNQARLDYLQISIDNVEPDELSMKSLRLLEPKLKWLAELADFSVNINSVIGGRLRNPEDA